MAGVRRSWLPALGLGLCCVLSWNSLRLTPDHHLLAGSLRSPDWRAPKDSSESWPTSRSDATFCLEHRGDDGRWELDWQYAEGHQYKTYGNFPAGMIANQLFQPSPNQPYRLPTAYRWLDSRCKTPTVTREGLCTVLKRLNVTLIYVAGDSMNEGFMTSLRGMMGHPKWGSIQFVRRILNFTCNDWTFSTLFKRVQTPNTDYMSFFFDLDLKENRRDLLSSNPGRSVILVNIGAHVHSLENFTQSFDRLTTSLRMLGRPNDIVFYRTAVPGHEGCFPRVKPRFINWAEYRDEAPYESYADYLPHATTLYDWHLIETYNKMARASLPPDFHWLNVYNSTVLRRDGHTGSEDCLHYSFPGPTDWWVHLWYAALWDLLAVEQNQ